MRIAVGGIGHETNTFSPLTTGLEQFHLRRGEEMIQGELWDQFREQGVEFVPILLASASPHGLVRRASQESLARVRRRDGPELPDGH